MEFCWTRHIGTNKREAWKELGVIVRWYAARLFVASLAVAMVTLVYYSFTPDSIDAYGSFHAFPLPLKIAMVYLGVLSGFVGVVAVACIGLFGFLIVYALALRI